MFTVSAVAEMASVLQIAVIDGAPGGADHRTAGLLVNGLFLQFLVLADLQVIQLPEERGKAHNAQ